MQAPAPIARLRELHEKAKRGTLTPQERAAYDALRAGVAQAVVSAQKVVVRPGETPAMAMRVPQAVKVSVTPAGGAKHSSITVDLAAGGFSALLPVAQAVGAVCDFEVNLGGEPLVGKGSVLSVQPHSGVSRVWISLDGLKAAQRERLEMFVLDAFLRSLPA